MAQALVPLKDLVEAKSRLAGILRPSERRALAQAMAEDVLAVLSSSVQVSRVTLVSDDPGAQLLAAHYGVRCWPERELACSRGLNPAIACASARLALDCDEPLLVLHADLPLLTHADIAAVLVRQAESGGLVIGCDRHGSGTNLLAFDVAATPGFCFGPDSCRKHQAMARASGISSTVIRRAGIELDVDEPGDLTILLTTLAAVTDKTAVAPHTNRLLGDAELGARVELALASLASEPVTGLVAGEAHLSEEQAS